MDILLWILVVVLIAVGVAGTVLPALPGSVLVFGGILLGAWIDNFERVSISIVVICADESRRPFGPLRPRRPRTMS